MTGRVAVVLHEPELGGATTSLLRALPLLEEHGWRFSFWVPGRGPAERELRRGGYEVATAERLLRFSRASLRRPPGPVRRLASVPGYLRGWRAWLRRQEADLIHANSVLALPEVTSRPMGGPPLVLHTHEVLPRGVKGWAAALLVRRADVVVSVSAAASRALRRYGIESIVVYPAVPDPGPLPTPGGRSARGRHARHRVAAQGKRPVRGCGPARPGAARRHRVPHRRGAGGGWRACLGGGGACRRGAQRRRPRGPGGAVRRAAEVAHLRAALAHGPVSACAAGGDGRGAARGGHAGGRIPEQVGPGGGVLVASEDVDGLAAAVLRLADSPELRAALGAAARERARRLFTPETQADGLDRVYRRALAGGAPGPPARARPD